MTDCGARENEISSESGLVNAGSNRDNAILRLRIINRQRVSDTARGESTVGDNGGARASVATSALKPAVKMDIRPYEEFRIKFRGSGTRGRLACPRRVPAVETKSIRRLRSVGCYPRRARGHVEWPTLDFLPSRATSTTSFRQLARLWNRMFHRSRRFQPETTDTHRQRTTAFHCARVANRGMSVGFISSVCLLLVNLGNLDNDASRGRNSSSRETREPVRVRY